MCVPALTEGLKYPEQITLPYPENFIAGYMKGLLIIPVNGLKITKTKLKQKAILLKKCICGIPLVLNAQKSTVKIMLSLFRK